ncbi:MAG: IS5/IS1182 family transposase, partial [Pseudomonadota bacterium]
IERTIGHLKDWRRIATRYDRLSSTYASTVALALVIQWWC